MTTEPVKAKSFVVVVDSDLEHILNVMIGAILKSDGDAFMRYLKNKGLRERYVAFLKEFSVKVHEHDMCGDPNCSHDLTSIDKPELSSEESIMGRTVAAERTSFDSDIGEGYIEDDMLVLDFGQPKRRIKFNKADLKQFLLGLGEIYKHL